MASAQCQAGLWTKAANTLVEAISKRPEGAQDILDIAMDRVQVSRAGEVRLVWRQALQLTPSRLTLRHGKRRVAGCLVLPVSSRMMGTPSASRLGALAAEAHPVRMFHLRNRSLCSCGKCPGVRSSSLPGDT